MGFQHWLLSLSPNNWLYADIFDVAIYKFVFDEVEPFYESTWDLYRESVAKFMQRSCCGVIIDNKTKKTIPRFSNVDAN